MNNINHLFDLLDEWRHFPNYQLERRSDIFFALNLPEVLECKLGFQINPILIPEFPLRLGTIYPEKNLNKSVKVDYVAFTDNGDSVVLVELKTESRSRREVQDHYLHAAKEVGFTKLLEGLLQIFIATNVKKKFHKSK